MLDQIAVSVPSGTTGECDEDSGTQLGIKGIAQSRGEIRHHVRPVQRSGTAALLSRCTMLQSWVQAGLSGASIVGLPMELRSSLEDTLKWIFTMCNRLPVSHRGALGSKAKYDSPGF